MSAVCDHLRSMRDITKLRYSSKWRALRRIWHFYKREQPPIRMEKALGNIKDLVDGRFGVVSDSS